MSIRKIARVLWLVPLILGVIAFAAGVLCLVNFEILEAMSYQEIFAYEPEASPEEIYRDARMYAYGGLAQTFIWGITFFGIGLIGITGQGKLKRDRVRIVMLLFSTVVVIWGSQLLIETFIPSTQARMAQFILALACIVAGISGILPIKWNKKFPIIQICVGLMVAMEIASIAPDMSSPLKAQFSLVTPLVIVAFYVIFLIMAFKCMQLSCDYTPTLPERIEKGEAIERPPAFNEQIETILMVRTDILELFYAIKRELPEDIEVAILTDSEQTIYLNADYWSAVIEKQAASDTVDVCVISFPDFKVDYQVENEYRAIEDMSIALTAIEKAILTLDAKALAQVRHASTKERAVAISSINNESADSLERFTVSGASRGAVNVAVSIGGGVVDDASSAHKNKKAAETQHQAEPLILRYLDTPALPEQLKGKVASGGFEGSESDFDGGESDCEGAASWYAAEAAKEEPSHKMTPNRKRQLTRSVAGLITVALVSSLFSFIINQSVPAANIADTVVQQGSSSSSVQADSAE